MLGPGRVIASLRYSWELVEYNAAQRISYTAIVFMGLGILVAILRFSLENMIGRQLGFILDLALWLPLQTALLVLATCWTLFYRELEARRHAQLAVPQPVHPDISARAS